MQQFFLESTWSLGLCGLLVALACGFWWTQSGARVAALCTLAMLVLTTILVVISLRVETDRERIRKTIDEVAEAIEQNDLPRVLGYIYSGATEGVTRAKQELPSYKFTEARLTRLKSIEVNRRTKPATAIAEFNVAVEIEAQGQRVPVRRFVKVYFSEQGGRWLVRDYEHFEPLSGLDQE